MKIESNGMHSANARQAEHEPPSKVSREASIARANHDHRGAPSDSVSFTAASVRLHDLEKKLMSLPAIDPRRVADIQEKLAGEVYRIDAQRIAAKFMRFEAQLPPG